MKAMFDTFEKDPDIETDKITLIQNQKRCPKNSKNHKQLIAFLHYRVSNYNVVADQLNLSGQ